MCKCFRKDLPEGFEEQEKKNKEIDKMIKQERKKHIYKLLLLGTGDSGKSTFTKQMTYLYNNGFEDDKLISFIEILRFNCLESAKILIEGLKTHSIEMKSKIFSKIGSVLEAPTLTPSVAKIIDTLWKEEEIQKLFLDQRISLPGGSSTNGYYLENALRFACDDYFPTKDDVLRAKHKTTGIIEMSFEFGDYHFSLVDVGGQRSERKKWLSCFSGVDAVIYLAALNEYDMKMEEDDKTNRLEESLKLFQKLSCSKWLKDIVFILFLNKSDIFGEKIMRWPLKKYFEDWDDFINTARVAGSDENVKNIPILNQSTEYIKKLYIDAFGGTRLYTFVTCALDTSSCEKVFLSIKDTILTTVINTNF